jgi:multidrug efflux pump subunit AcrA (membrane-fusion protein)
MANSLQSGGERQRSLVVALSILTLAGAAWAAVREANRRPKVPTAEVKRSEFVDYLELRGQVKTIHSVVVTAPSDAEDLQILHLVHDGARVKKGDSLVEFDATKLKATFGPGPFRATGSGGGGGADSSAVAHYAGRRPYGSVEGRV